MTLLFASMLAGLAALAVPVVLHLIAKQRFTVVDLPTIRLLDAQKRTNTLAMRLVDRWQLLLRLLVLLLMVLAMARCYTTWSPGPAAPRNVVLVLDTSASMRMRQGTGGTDGTAFELARRQALELLAGLPPGSRCGVVADGAAGALDVAPSTDLAAVRTALTGLATIDGSGRGMVRSVADACAMLHGRRSVAAQVIVFSDLRTNAFAARDRAATERIARTTGELGGALELVFVDGGAPVGNLGIVDAYVRGGEARIGEDAHLVATIASSGDEPRDATLRLAVAERREPQARKITVQPHTRTVVDLTARMNRSQQTLARFELTGDAYEDDDTRAVPLNVGDTRRLLLVDGSGAADSGAAGRAGLERLAGGAAPTAGAPAAPAAKAIGGATILRFALNPGRELGLPSGTGIDTTLVAPEALTAQPLSTFETVVLYDVSGLSDQAIEDLRTFVAQGRSLLIVASGATSAVGFNRTLAGGKTPLAPVQLGNDETLETAVGIRLDGDQTLLAPFRDPAQGDLSVVKLLALRQLRDLPEDARVLMRASDGRPLAVEAPRGRGRVVLLATGFELARGNLARTRVFPALVWRLVDYLGGRTRTRPPDHVQALRPTVLDVSEPALSLVEHIELTSASATTATTVPAVRLERSGDGAVLLPPLAAGAYTIHRARAPGEGAMGYARYVTTHIAEGESDMARLPDDQYKAIFGGSARRVPATALGDLDSRGGEWTILLAALLALLYAVEAVTGWISGSRRERERAAGGAS